jgi:uncharacterized protein
MYKFFSSLLVCAFAPAALAQVNKELPLVDLKIQGHSLKAELAKDNETRSTGLMNRFSLKPDHGMLFIFKEAAMVGMWMKNTYIPLSVAFIDEKGVILNIENMKPQALETHTTVAPALYALEMKMGWFDAKGIKPGAKIEGLAKLGKATN